MKKGVLGKSEGCVMFEMLVTVIIKQEINVKYCGKSENRDLCCRCDYMLLAVLAVSQVHTGKHGRILTR